MDTLIFLAIVLFLLVIVVTFSENDEAQFACGILAIMFVVAVTMVAIFEVPKTGYKQGQIDALQSKFKYEQQFVYRDTICMDTLYVEIIK